jgi:hypothetical protein
MVRRITRAEAQGRFICALETFCDRDKSPLKRLLEEFYPEWKAAFSNPDSRYVSARQQEQAVQTARGVLKQWAAACNLVSADSGSTPHWLIDYADAYLKELATGARNRNAAGLSTTQLGGGILGVNRLSIASNSSVPSLGIGGGIVKPVPLRY